MKSRRSTVGTWLTVFVGGTMLGLAGLAADSKLPIPPPPKATDTTDTTHESLEVRYARLQLDLAETNLRRARGMNQKVTNVVPANTVAEYQSLVVVAQANLENRLHAKTNEPMKDWLQNAQATALAAETRYRTAIAANQRMAGTFEETDVERLRILAELAKLQVERGHAAESQPFEAQMRWQLDVLSAEMLQIQEQLRRAPPTSGGYLYPWGY